MSTKVKSSDDVKAEKKSKIPRTRNFATIVYPESAPDNWLEILSETHIPAFVSPLHDKDLTATGEPKKPHYHVLIMFDSVKTYEQAIAVFDKIGGVGFFVVEVLRSMARYFCHLDDANKARYDIKDVIELSGSNYNDIISSSSDRYRTFGEMMDFCDYYNVNSFYLLSKYARLYKSDWYRILCDSGTVFMKEFLKSREWSSGRGELHIVDQETGEVVI